jgi:hypothetical protein
MIRRLPRTIQLDDSDLAVFDLAARTGEWAVPGSFSFLADTQAPTGKRRTAFANGFLGTGSFGWSTLVTVELASEDDIETVTAALTTHFIAEHGAPSVAAAAAVARREVAFARSLCEHPAGTILTVSRRFEGEELVEQFKTITQDGSACGPHAPIDLTQFGRDR